MLIQRLKLLALLLALAGCAEGPYYRIVSLTHREGRDELILAKWWQRPPFYLLHIPQLERFTYYGARQENASICAAELLDQRDWLERARFVPIAASEGAFVRVLSRAEPHSERTTLSFARVESGKSAVELAEIDGSGLGYELSTCGYAVTRSGRQLLIVDDQSLRVFDTLTGRVIEHSSDDLLLDARRAFVRGFGSAGRWWLSEDRGHVVIESPDWDTRTGMGTPEVTWLEIGGVRFRADDHGLIYDREKRTVTPYALEVRLKDQPYGFHHRIRVCDADVVDGRVWLLYQGGAGQHVLVLATQDLSQQYMARVQFRDRNLFALTSIDWQPDSGVVRLLECEQYQQLSSPISGRSPDWCIHSWSYRTGEITQDRIEDPELRKAIERAK